jgi:hypothetical protein
LTLCANDVYDWAKVAIQIFSSEEVMAKTRLTRVAEKVGKAVGTADRRAHEAVKKAQHASKVAKGELSDIAKEVESLKKRLQKATTRMQKALK